MDLQSRVVLITGARRIGIAVALAVAERGADVAISYHRSRIEADETVEGVRKLGRRAVAIQADLSDPSACERVVTDAAREFGRLDVLLHMASLYESIPFDEMTFDAWERHLAVDLRAAFLTAKVAVPLMRKIGGGRIVYFSDWLVASGRPRYPGYMGYYVAKAGVKALTEALALEVAADNILVNAVAPGPILAAAGTPESAYQAVEKATPLGRWGGSGEIAKAVLALIDTDFMTGETIRVDGGRHVY